jgi:hypothetical protein
MIRGFFVWSDMTKTINLTNNKGQAIVDDADFEWLNKYKWRLSNAGYADRNTFISGQASISMHRQILGLEYGDGKECDHINGDRLDNRRENLRIVTRQQNSWNRIKSVGCTSQYKGVHWSARNKKWKSAIRRKHLGTFTDEADAARAYDAAARELFGEFAHLNFPDQRSE